MFHVVRKSAATVAVAAVLASPAAVASAAPMIDGFALKSAAPAQLEDVRWHGGWGIGLGALAAGAIIGGALAAPYYYGPGYYPGPYYPAPYYAPPYYEGAPAGDVAYCAQRYRSYDPGSGTFLGNDGHRHPCP